MAVKGIFASDSGIVGERRGDFASSLLKHVPNGTAPLLALSSGMKSRGAGDTVVTWFEENFNTGRVSITNNASTGTSLTVSAADAKNIVVGQIYMIEASGEYIFVEAVNGTTITVERGFGSTTVTAVDGSSTAKPMQRIGTAHEEGSSRPTAIANLGYPVLNYTQIFRNAWDVTGTAQAVQWHTGDKIAKNKRDCSNFHAEDIERSLIWGVQSVGVLNSKPFRTMAGALSFITTNVAAQVSAVYYTQIRDFLESLFLYNIQGQPNERIAFCGNSVIGVLDTLAMTFSQFQVKAAQTDFGMNIHRWTTPFGTINLMTHPLMNINPVWTKEMYVFHPAAITMRWLRKTTQDNYDRDGSRAGVDADYGVITSELSIELKGEKTCGKFTGIDTAYVTDLDGP